MNSTNDMEDTVEITAKELYYELKEGTEMQVIDVRSKDEYLNGSIPGSLNIPLYSFASEIQNIDLESNIVVVCSIGQSSLQAIRLLKSYTGVPQGAKILNLSEGYYGWTNLLSSNQFSLN
jgi:rhodanese-related sulfurtransferase